MLCKSKHDLNSCKSFVSKSLSDRKAFLKDKRLCFGCFNLDIFPGAENKERHARYVQKHPTSLHGDSRGQQSKVVKTGTMGTDSSSVSNDAHTNNAIIHTEESTLRL